MEELKNNLRRILHSESLTPFELKIVKDLLKVENHEKNRMKNLCSDYKSYLRNVACNSANYSSNLWDVINNINPSIY